MLQFTRRIVLGQIAFATVAAATTAPTTIGPAIRRFHRLMNKPDFVALYEYWDQSYKEQTSIENFTEQMKKARATLGTHIRSSSPSISIEKSGSKQVWVAECISQYSLARVEERFLFDSQKTPLALLAYKYKTNA